ncbi:MAG: DMT family transporter [Caulobacterales bacterium]|jgi:quaternary ammonium compound-resistance protein SugE
MSIGWAFLIIAGLFEVGFTTAMTFAQRGAMWGWPLFLVCISLSFWFLNLATKTIPIGIGYAVWTGIGAAGTLFVSAALMKAPITPAQIGFVALLIASVVGLKLTAKG